MDRYLVTIVDGPDHYEVWDALSDPEQQLVLDDFRAFTDAIRERGAIVGGESLAPATPADRLRTSTAGPFAETAEQLVGFYVVDVPTRADVDRAARLLPAAYGVVVRACPDVGVTPR